jgi:diaminopropionate ammonia-lyase
LCEEAQSELEGWPCYEATPLVELPEFAALLGVKNILVKDESRRRPLGNFKALGGAYAVYRYIRSILMEHGGTSEVNVASLAKGEFGDFTRERSVSCATDGNHGMSVAWAARRFHTRCVIYVPQQAEESRCNAIRSLGAELVRVPGNYDVAVATAQADAIKCKRQIISDTSYDEYSEIPRWVMAGYTLLCKEVLGQIEDKLSPTHYFIPVGCGSLATAVAEELLPQTTVGGALISVEPLTAGCLFRSIAQGARSAISGSHETIMVGLACGEVSQISWASLRDRVDYCMMIGDQHVESLRVAMTKPSVFPVPVDGGSTGIAGLAAMLAATEDAEIRSELGITTDSVLFSIITESKEPKLEP